MSKVDTRSQPAPAGVARGRDARIEARERNDKWKALPLVISESDCIRCDACMRHCPPHFGAIFNLRHDVIIIPELCSGCEKCVPACPMGSIRPSEDWNPSPEEWWNLPGSRQDPHVRRQRRSA